MSPLKRVWKPLETFRHSWIYHEIPWNVFEIYWNAPETPWIRRQAPFFCILDICEEKSANPLRFFETPLNRSGAPFEVLWLPWNPWTYKPQKPLKLNLFPETLWNLLRRFCKSPSKLRKPIWNPLEPHKILSELIWSPLSNHTLAPPCFRSA